MAVKITDDCVNCGVCASVCPVEAISEGTTQHVVDPEECVECEGYADKPQCMDACPMDAIVKE